LKRDRSGRERKIEAFVETYFYAPNFFHRLLSFALLPFAGLYGGGMWLRRRLTRRRSFPFPIISIGNLVVGGSGKTPFTIALASRYEGVWIVSRGYGRRSRGLVEVSRPGEILASVEESGDEAMEMARALPQAGVLVSEDRIRGIERARELGAKVVVLDDGFNRVEIEKFEILLEPERLPNRFVLPAGPFREFPSTASRANLRLKEGREYRREVTVLGATERMVLLTSIARPERLDPWLPPGVVARIHRPDHAWFDERELREILERYGATSFLVTGKDAVKLEGFQLPLSRLALQLRIDPSVWSVTDRYMKEFHAT
jgi:tetraacyldisaccharide 4'-kinase